MPDSLSDLKRQFAVEVVRKLRDAGFEAYWAGGCVRDQLLGLTPKDYDVATSAAPDEVREVFGRRRTLPIGAAFGVITVRGRREQGQIEVATFRQDATYSDGRHPDAVLFSNPQQDAQRRDFTINGLFFDPLTEQVIDYVDGLTDLKRRRIRAIGNADARIDEDKLRMLRAVRFAATYEFEIDPDTLQAIRRHAGEIEVVSAERIAGEMRRMLVHPSRAQAVELLQESGLLEIILPESHRLPAPAWQQTLQILGCLQNTTFSMALAVLLRESSREDDQQDLLRHVSGRWKLSNEETVQAAWLLQNEAAIRQASTVEWSDLQPILVGEQIADLLDYAEAVARVVDGTIAKIDHCRNLLKLPAEELNPAPLITGDDLKAAGIPPGKIYRPLLDAIRKVQLEKHINTHNEALQMANELRTKLEADE